MEAALSQLEPCLIVIVIIFFKKDAEGFSFFSRCCFTLALLTRVQLKLQSICGDSGVKVTTFVTYSYKCFLDVDWGTFTFFVLSSSCVLGSAALGAMQALVSSRSPPALRWVCEGARCGLPPLLPSEPQGS